MDKNHALGVMVSAGMAQAETLEDRISEGESIRLGFAAGPP